MSINCSWTYGMNLGSDLVISLLYSGPSTRIPSVKNLGIDDGYAYPLAPQTKCQTNVSSICLRYGALRGTFKNINGLLNLHKSNGLLCF